MNVQPNIRRAIDDRERTLLLAVNQFLKLRQRMPLRCIQALLMVSLHPRENVSDLARLARVANSTMSRNLLDIGERTRTGEPGLGLVRAVTSPGNASALAYELTAAGRALLDKVTGILA